MLKKWEDLPDFMRVPEVRPYWEHLRKKKVSLVLKRLFDLSASLLLLVILSPVFVILAFAIKIDSRGPVFFRQERVTQYGRIFKIHKFRSMKTGAEKSGLLITVGCDSRITRVGKFIRKTKLDETSQLIDILLGDMSFVGTRPEVKKYVDCYTNEMKATLLLPAGVTSSASIMFKNENSIVESYKKNDIDEVYTKIILPEKMKYNLLDISHFSLFSEMVIMINTPIEVIKK